MDDIQKLRFHIRLLAESLDPRTHPTPSLVIENDWGAEDLDAAHDVFEEFDRRLTEGEVNWYEFEKAFEDRFRISYQGLKSVVLAFFRNGQWLEVCRAYAIQHNCLEFSEITRDRTISSLEDSVSLILLRSKLEYSRESQISMKEKKFHLDFLVKNRNRTIAIEVKASSSIDHALPILSDVADAIRSSRLADEFWVVTEHSRVVGREILEKKGIKFVVVDQLEGKLME